MGIEMNKEQIESLAAYIGNNPTSIKHWLDANPLKPTLPNGVDLYNFADFLKYNYGLDYSNERIQDDISAWFEGGLKQEPIVVGLTHEQINRLCDHLNGYGRNHCLYTHHINSFLDKEVFEVKETVVGLSDEQAENFIKFYWNTNANFGADTYKEWAKTQTFATPEVKEIPIELSDSQIQELAKIMVEAYDKHWGGINVGKIAAEIIEFLKTQTFLQQHQFTSDWSTAPEWANWFAQDCDGQCLWYERKPTLDSLFGVWKQDRGEVMFAEGFFKDWDKSLQQRPTPPAPKVEVGQFWRFKNSDDKGYKLVALTQIEGIDYAVLELKNGQYPSYDKESFFAEFERVGGSE
jgi:hypothetical protein